MVSRSKEDPSYISIIEKLRTREVYKHSLLLKKLSTAGNRFTLITDYDNSLYHDATAQDTHRLLQKSDDEAVPAIVVTGNSLEKLQVRCATQGVEVPDVILSSVGTHIWLKQEDGSFLEDTGFTDSFDFQRFNRLDAAQRGKLVIDHWSSDPEKTNVTFSFQDPEVEELFLAGQTVEVEPRKLSFHFFAFDEEVEQIIHTLQATFNYNSLVWCEEVRYNDDPLNSDEIKRGVKRKKYCLDILAVTPKVVAANYLIQLCGFQDALVVGDSGNDLDLLLGTTVGISVIVAGSKPELEKKVLAVATKDESLSSLEPDIDVYRLDNGKIVLHILGADNPMKYAAASITRALAFRDAYLV